MTFKTKKESVDSKGNKIVVGDTVDVVRTGKTYDTYKDAFGFLKFRNPSARHKGYEGKYSVVNMILHEYEAVTMLHLTGVKNGEEIEFLIGSKGVVLSESNTVSVSKEFILQAYNAACPEWKKKLENEIPSILGDESVVASIGDLVEVTFLGNSRRTHSYIIANVGNDTDSPKPSMNLININTGARLLSHNFLVENMCSITKKEFSVVDSVCNGTARFKYKINRSDKSE